MTTPPNPLSPLIEIGDRDTDGRLQVRIAPPRWTGATLTDFLNDARGDQPTRDVERPEAQLTIAGSDP